MILTQRQKILAGLATAWTLLYPLLFFAVALLLTLGVAVIPVDQQSSGPPVLFFAIFPLHCLTIVIMLGLMVFYLAHIIKNRSVSDSVRVVFGVGIYLMPYIAMPIYYYFFIWRDDIPGWARGDMIGGEKQ